jgi:hypothetical protein
MLKVYEQINFAMNDAEQVFRIHMSMKRTEQDNQDLLDLVKTDGVELFYLKRSWGVPIHQCREVKPTLWIVSKKAVLYTTNKPTALLFKLSLYQIVRKIETSTTKKLSVRDMTWTTMS